MPCVDVVDRRRRDAYVLPRHDHRGEGSGARPRPLERTIDVTTAALGLALVDSLNPSAIAVTTYLVLAGSDVVRRVLTYVWAIYLTYLSVGLVLLGGLGAAAGRLGSLTETPEAYAVQGVVGALMLSYGALAPSRRQSSGVRTPRSDSLGAVFALGLVVSLVEFPTALPYLAALALITQAGLGQHQYVPLLAVYNLVLVLPPLLILGASRLAGAESRGRFERWRERLVRNSRTTFLALLAVIGFVLLADALVYFEFFGLIDLPPELRRPAAG